MGIPVRSRMMPVCTRGVSGQFSASAAMALAWSDSWYARTWHALCVLHASGAVRITPSQTGHSMGKVYVFTGRSALVMEPGLVQPS